MNRTYWATVLGVALVCLSAVLARANPEITVGLPGGATMEFVWIEPGTEPPPGTPAVPRTTPLSSR